MVDVNVDFVLEKDTPVEADFTLHPDVTYTADIKVETSVKEHDKLLNRDLPNQHPVEAITGLENALSELSGGIDSNHQAISGINQTISSYGDIVTHNVNEFATSSQGALADTALQPNDNITELNNNAGYITIASVPTAVSQLTNDSGYQTGTQVANSISVETSNRELADNNLQSQIDAIVSSSDVFDIVGTYAELQAYDISTVPVNDIIKVLVDSTHGGAATYYRCVESDSVKSWSYIGSEGAYYTKGEADGLFVPQTRTVNGKALSSNITLTAGDVGALPSTTSIPTKTSDLTNDSGYITGITSSNVTTALGYTPYNSSNPAGYTSNVGTVTSVNNTQPDANGNVTISTGGSYTAGTGIDITNNAVSVTSPTLTNTATGTGSLTVGGTKTTYAGSTNVGILSRADSFCTAIGYGANARSSDSIAIGTDSSASGSYSKAIGDGAKCIGLHSTQIGYGTNSEDNSFYVGTSHFNNWKLLGSDGKIPSGRLPIATSVSSSSTNDETVGAKLFYDTCGNIESAINTIRGV